MRGIKTAAILAFLALQLLLPVRGLATGAADSRANFSWNMYSDTFSCRVMYMLITPEGDLRHIDYRSYFRRPERGSIVFRRDTLPRFHEYLCDLHRSNGELGRLIGNVTCSENGQPSVALVDPGADVCTAENFGVVE
ncbi:MAG: HTTM domain-containing protein [bacterium]|nr:HTTM domain-containing protein [bacterium]